MRHRNKVENSHVYAYGRGGKLRTTHWPESRTGLTGGLTPPVTHWHAGYLSFPAFPNGPSHGVDCPCKKCRAVPREGWRTDAWAAWFVLAWLRLVRATHSRRTAAWHGAQHERRRKLRTGSDTGDAAAGMLGDTRTNRADARTHRRHSQQQHSWVNDQLPPERLRCYWGCRGECRPAVHSTPPTDGEESDGDKSSSGGHEGDGSTRSDADAGGRAHPQNAVALATTHRRTCQPRRKRHAAHAARTRYSSCARPPAWHSTYAWPMPTRD